MHRHPLLVRILVAGAVALAVSMPVGAAVDVEVTNGSKVIGSIVPESAPDRLSFDVPDGARLTVIVKGKRVKGGATPRATFRLLDDEGREVPGAGTTPRGTTGAILRKFAIPAAGTYAIEVSAQAGDRGDYQAKIKWKSPKRVDRDVALGTVPVVVRIPFETGAIATITLAPARGSLARPRLLRIVPAVGGDAIEIPQPSATATKQKVKKLHFAMGGAHDFVVANEGAPGDVRLRVSTKPPKVNRLPISLPRSAIALSAMTRGVAFGRVVSGVGGVVMIADDDASDLSGAEIRVPAGALRAATSMVVASSRTFDGLPDGVRQVGSAILIAPIGQRLESPATVTLPFTSSAFGGDFSTLVVASRDARGRVRVSKIAPMIDTPSGATPISTVSFAVEQGGEYAVVGVPPPVRSDLNGDGVSDYVYSDLSASVGVSNRLVVVFGSRDFSTRAIGSQDVVLVEAQQDTVFGQAWTTGDVNGDGIADLVVSDRQSTGLTGNVYVFFGGPNFSGTVNPRIDADVVLRGPVTGARFGSSVAVGDLVGDGTADIAVSALHVGFGSSMPDVTVFEGGKSLASGASPVARVAGPVALNDESFGGRLAIADVTGDGRADLLISAARANAPGPVGDVFSEGAVYVFAGPVTFDEALRADADVTLVGTSVAESFGAKMIVGDVTGDGVADIIVSTRPFALVPNDVLVFAGGVALADTDTSGARLVIRGIDGIVTKRFGESLVVIDIDADGVDDLVIGDSVLPTADAFRGGVAVFLGGATLSSGTILDADQIIRSTVDGSTFGHAVDAVDVTGDGKPELLVRTFARGGNTGRFESEAFVYRGGVLPGSTDAAADFVLTGLLAE